MWTAIIVLLGLIERDASERRRDGRMAEREDAVAGERDPGSRVGAGPMGEAERGDTAPRIWVSYWCANGHETRRASPRRPPSRPRRPGTARAAGSPPGRTRRTRRRRRKNEPYKTHLAYVKERRSDEDGAAILDEALAALRAKRGG